MKKLHLLGHPVSQSLSPVMQNAAFKHLGLDWTYSVLDVPAQDLVGTLENLEADPEVIGCNVTVPHKVAVFQWLGLHRSEPGAMQAHASNTLFRGDRLNPASRFRGDSTDFGGGLLALSRLDAFRSEAVVTAPDLTGWEVAIVGTGGSANSFGFLLGKSPLGASSLTIFGRDPVKAKDLADRINRWLPGQGIETRALPLSEFAAWNQGRRSIVIQTTTVGMDTGENPGRSPVPEGSIGLGQVAFDLVYKPNDTPFLLDAEKNGAMVVHGIGMLVGQGALALQHWIEASANREFKAPFEPRDVMEVMRNSLLPELRY